MQGNAMLNLPDCVSIIKAVPDLYLIIDPTLTIVEASDAYLSATMVARDEVIGHNIFEIFPDNPNDPKATGTTNLKRSLQKVLTNKTAHAMRTQKYDIRLPLSEGGAFEERYWRPLNSPVLDTNNQVKYIIHRVEDVTELHRLKNSKAESAQRLQLLLENIKDYAIIMLDENEHVTTWNAGAERIIGYKADEIIGKPISIIYPTRSFEHEFKIARKLGRYEEEGWRERKEGSRFWADVIVTPVYDMKNKLIGYGKVVRDLTLKKEIEIAKNEFISIVNHELRTPLTSILGAIRLLLNWSSLSRQRNNELLDIANANCDRLMRLINDILDIEKLASGVLSFHMQEVELNSIIANSITINRIYSRQFGVTLNSSPLPFEIIVNIDPNRIVQVLTNLISNAIKFSVPGGEVNIALTKKKEGGACICN